MELYIDVLGRDFSMLSDYIESDRNLCFRELGGKEREYRKRVMIRSIDRIVRPGPKIGSEENVPELDPHVYHVTLQFTNRETERKDLNRVLGIVRSGSD